MKTFWLTCATAVATAAALAGCAETGTGDDSTGSLAAAVTATGADGATYRLPAGTYVQVWNDTFNDYFLMDGDDPVVSIELPVGDYNVSLVNGGGYTFQWPLERTNVDATTETVESTLLTPQPISVSIFEDATTTLVFQFLVVDGGTVTFAHGVLDISIDVDVTESVMGRAMFSGTYVKNYELYSATAPADLSTHVPAMGSNVFHQITVNVAGDWEQTSSYSACSSATLYGGVVSLSIYDLTREAWLSGATARVCIYGAPYDPTVWVSSSRTGAALTPAFQSYGALDFYFDQSMTGVLPDQIFDGTTLDLGAMTGTFDVAANLRSDIWASGDGGASWDNWYTDSNDGATITFQFLPTL